MAITISFWLYSRFTVDDAFITWRYGYNLVQRGIWAYNPSSIDVTQAYTDFLYAILGIIPPFFSIDVVLFFKLVSIILLISCFIWFYRKTRCTNLLLVLYAAPITFIHAFSGLSTFLFGFIAALVFIFLTEGKLWAAIATTIVLTIVRPEGWPLILFGSLTWLTDERYCLMRRVKTAFVFFLITSLGLLLQLYFNYFFFQNLLPNTFYVKNGASLDIQYLIFLLACISPLIFYAIITRAKYCFAIICYLLVICLDYSVSHLSMNYMNRFAFQIFLPTYLFCCYLLTNRVRHHQIRDEYPVNGSVKPRINVGNILAIALVFSLGLITTKNTGYHNFIYFSDYYPRLLQAQGLLGNDISSESPQPSNKAMSFGDAGLLAYNSGSLFLDTNLLATAQGTRNGFDRKLLNEYMPRYVILYSYAPEKHISSFHTADSVAATWAKRRGYKYRCSVVFKKNYFLAIFSRKKLTHSVNQACKTSKRLNYASEKSFFKGQIISAPWHFWNTSAEVSQRSTDGN